jgi:hypothetical protein
MASEDMIYVQIFMKICSDIQIIWEAAMLLLLMGRMYDICRWDDLRWYDM